MCVEKDPSDSSLSLSLWHALKVPLRSSALHHRRLSLDRQAGCWGVVRCSWNVVAKVRWARWNIHGPWWMKTWSKRRRSGKICGKSASWTSTGKWATLMATAGRLAEDAFFFVGQKWNLVEKLLTVEITGYLCEIWSAPTSTRKSSGPKSWKKGRDGDASGRVVWICSAIFDGV